MDELRDYRFYAEDMIHTSDQTTAYIWEKFQEVLIHGTSHEIIKDLEPLLRMREHRPMSKNKEAQKKMENQVKERMNYIKSKYPKLDLDNFLKISV
jgi:hypothetical protein